MYYEKYCNPNATEWIVFIHGLGGSSKTWKYQIDAFKNYNIICVDLYGHGKSLCINSKRIIDKTIDGIHNILNIEGIIKAHIVSLSLGTIVAMEFMCKYPERIKSMVLAGCVLNMNTAKKVLTFCVNIIKHILPVKWAYKIFAKVIMPKDNHKLSRSIFVREALKLTRNSFNSWVNTLMTSQFRLKEYVSKLNSLNLPILLVNGKEDYLFTSGVQRLKTKIQNCRLEIIKKCGHVCSIDKKEQFNDIALNFLCDLS